MRQDGLEANSDEVEEKKKVFLCFFSPTPYPVFPGATQGELRPFRASPDFRTEIISPGKVHLDREQPRPRCRMTRMMRRC